MPIEQIDKDSLPELPKAYLELDKTDVDIASTDDDKYLLRILIDKVNELTIKVNELSGS